MYLSQNCIAFSFVYFLWYTRHTLCTLCNVCTTWPCGFYCFQQGLRSKTSWLFKRRALCGKTRPSCFWMHLYECVSLFSHGLCTCSEEHRITNTQTQRMSAVTSLGILERAHEFQADRSCYWCIPNIRACCSAKTRSWCLFTGVCSMTFLHWWSLTLSISWQCQFMLVCSLSSLCSACLLSSLFFVCPQSSVCPTCFFGCPQSVMWPLPVLSVSVNMCDIYSTGGVDVRPLHGNGDAVEEDYDEDHVVKHLVGDDLLTHDTDSVEEEENWLWHEETGRDSQRV